METSVVEIEGMRFWRTRLNGLEELEPIELQAGEFSLRRTAGGLWKLDTVRTQRRKGNTPVLRFKTSTHYEIRKAMAAVRKFIEREKEQENVGRKN
jgi:hypothetical protein